MRIEVLYFDGCPNHEALLPRLRGLLVSEGISSGIDLRRITDDEAAQRERFLGSPTVRVNGQDVEPYAEKRSDYGMKCRRSQLGDRECDHPLKADDACGQVDLPEPPLADLDVGANVHVRPGDRAFSLLMVSRMCRSADDSTCPPRSSGAGENASPRSVWRD